MRPFNNQLSKNTLIIFYKLLHDSLFVALIFFALALIFEAVLPGIIISHIGFSKIVITLLLNIFLLKMLAKKITPDQVDQTLGGKKGNQKKITVIIAIIGTLLVFNSQLGLNTFLNFFLLAISGAVTYLSYRILFD